MPLLDQIRANKLIEIAHAHFDLKLSDAEKKVLRDSASSEDLPDPGENAPRPEVRAEFLRWLVTDLEVAPNIDPKGLRVYDATIAAKLDLENCHVGPPLDFRRSTFQSKIKMQSAETRGMYFFNSSLENGIDAGWAKIHGPLFLKQVQSEGEIALVGVEVDADLVCAGSKLNSKEDALRADGARIGGCVQLINGFESIGAIRLMGAQIAGDLRCNGAKLKAKGVALFADRARIGGAVFLYKGFESEGEIRLPGADIKGTLECDGAKLKAEGDALSFHGAKIGGSVFLRGGFESEGAIGLLGAEIGANLDCTSAKLRGKVDALSAHNARIGGNVFLRQGFESEGAIRLLGADIKGSVVCSSARLRATGAGLAAQNARIGGNFFLDQGFESDGTIQLVGAEITGNLECDGAKLKAKGEALSAHNARIGGNAFLRNGFESGGAVHLVGAEIAGSLVCDGAKLKTRGEALSIYGAKIGGTVYIRSGFESEGTICMIGAEVIGDLSCSGAKLNTPACAIDAEGVKIGGNILLDGGFESLGEIRLQSAQVGGSIECRGAKLRAEGDSLVARGAKIGGNVSLRQESDQLFEAVGRVRLTNAEIGGGFFCSGAMLAKVYCRNLVIAHDLIWQRVKVTEETKLKLVGARMKNLQDDIESWPKNGNLELDGLVYEGLVLHKPQSVEDLKENRLADELPLTARERIRWLMLQRHDRRLQPQPWMQLRELLEKKGDRKGAKYALYRFRCLQAGESWLLWRWLRKAFAWLEENPLRIVESIAATLLLGTIIFAWGGSKHAMIETVKYLPNAVTDRGELKPVSPHYPRYQPFVYTLENAVPLVRLGMDDKWTPDPGPEFRGPWFPHLSWLYFVSTYGILMFTRWALIVLGWVQATVFIAAVSDRFKK